MKHTVPLLLALCLLFSACQSGKPTTPTGDILGSTGFSTENSTQDTTQDTTGDTTLAQGIPEPLYRHPLTGKGLDAPWYGRPVAVVVNNIKDAQPLYGISQADILYEIETEGGITRMLAVFSDLTQVEKVGPVRSARTYFNNIALSYGAPVVHCGGSKAALRGQYDDSYDTISRWQHINEQTNGSYFYRDQDRKQQGYAYEHTLFTTGQKLLQAMDHKGYNVVSDTPADFGLNFVQDPQITGSTANTVTVKFQGDKTTTMTYNPETGLYYAAQYGSDIIDAGNEKAVAFRNVLVLYTSQWFINDGTYYRAYYDLIGSGEGLYACDGQIIPIKWTRDTLRGTFSYTLEDGTPLILGAGQSYIAVTYTKATASYS